MKRRVWVGTVALGLGGLVSGLQAQQTTWRPVVRTVARPTVRAVSRDYPRASLGRPMTAADGPDLSPRPFPTAYRNDAVASTAARSGVEPIAAVPPAGAIIAVSGPHPSQLPASLAEADDHQGTEFASDRVPPPQAAVPAKYNPPAFLPAATKPPPELQMPAGKPEVEPLKNWQGTFPVTPPAPAPEGGHEYLSTVDTPASWYGRAEYLLWWTKNDKTPIPLVTTGSPGNNGVIQQAGALGRADTVVLSDGVLDRNPFSGGRFTLGYVYDECGQRAVEVSGFFLSPRSSNFGASSAFNQVLTRPFFDVNNGQQSVERVAFPGFSTGNVQVHSPSELWGIEANHLKKWCCGCDYRVDVLAGVRYLDLRERLGIVENVQTDPTTPLPFDGNLVRIEDVFATHNQFYGAQVGIQGAWQFGRLTLDGRAKLALGVTHQTLSINGSQQFPPGTPNVDTRPGGLYALNSNIGTYSRNQFSVVPEVGVSVGYDVAENLRLSVGYNFLYWSSVVRPGDQIDPNLDITRIPNFARPAGTQPVSSPHPAVLFKDTDYWAQGLTFGVEFRY